MSDDNLFDISDDSLIDNLSDYDKLYDLAQSILDDYTSEYFEIRHSGDNYMTELYNLIQDNQDLVDLEFYNYIRDEFLNIYRDGFTDIESYYSAFFDEEFPSWYFDLETVQFDPPNYTENISAAPAA